MIKRINEKDITECVKVIKESFITVASEFGFVHIGTQKFDFFPFTCGYMEKNLCC